MFQVQYFVFHKILDSSLGLKVPWVSKFKMHNNMANKKNNYNLTS